MNQNLCILLSLVGLMSGSSRLLAQFIGSVEYSQRDATYNWQSQRGVPISSVTNAPIGSDGRMPSASVTTNQFQGLVSFGAVTAPFDWLSVSNSSILSGTVAFSSDVAVAMQLPVGRTNGTNKGPNNPVCIVLRRAQISAPYLSRNVSFPFGSIVSVPETDINGVLLTNVAPADYWMSQPYSGTNDTNVSYYWSKNAQVVFATQPGPISINWIRKEPSSDTNYTNPNGPDRFVRIDAADHQVYTAKYIVSGTAVKPPQKIYWTEGSFQSLGYPVSVPSARVTAIQVVYNPAFPEKVETPYADPTVVLITDSTNMVQEFRTLWFGNGQIRAYNAEGRVFVELLGANTSGDRSEYLGFEIVDVSKAAPPSDVTIELGERLTAYQDGSDDSNLDPSPIQNTLGQQFYYQHSSGSGKILYADRATQNRNDLLVHWLTTGVAGLKWPCLFDRYSLVWPSDPAKYSHYLRPQVATRAEATLTAVQLDGQEAPMLDYQDPLDQTRGWLTTSYVYYTFLNTSYPAHRALLRFVSGDQVRFERVFSWLDSGIKDNAFLSDSVATTLDAWNTNTSKLAFSDSFVAPYMTNAAVNVGDRINAPANELGATGNYWAGYLLEAKGNAFNPGVYLNPFAVGFNNANHGAIIPVNAIPGQDQLEVWWFRRNNADPVQGFQPVYWPTVIGHYTIQWPTGTREIIMAGNEGSGPLDSIEAKGEIYYQNDPTLPGYNPNEEHALMLGSQAYALRDDLNTITSNGYTSSAPFVLINYTGSDGRPAMSIFKVRRESPEAGILFDYVVSAGTMLQAPMPLPLMQPPIEGVGASATNYNTEPSDNSRDLPVGWSEDAGNGSYALYQKFTFEDRKNNFWVYRGPHAGLPPLQVGQYDVISNIFKSLPNATAVVGQPFKYFVHISRLVESLTMSDDETLPDGLSIQTTNGALCIDGTPTMSGSNLVTLVITDSGDSSCVTNYFVINVATNGEVSALGPLVITSTNQYSHTMVSYTNRPPNLAQAPTPSNSFTMRYYYKTRSDFAWPGINNPPDTGTIVPYLRRVDTNGGFVGDATDKMTASLDIIYRPVWPEIQNQKPLPVLNSGQTLTTPVNGLAAVRGQSSVQVLYQQSIGANFTDAPPSVTLYDPTVQKTSSLVSMGGLPTGVLAVHYQDKMYFQNLPPNLVNRLYYDPRTTNLVFQGQFIDDPVGEKYLLLNVLSDADLTAAQGLCPITDSDYPNWVAAIANLSTSVYTFHEDPKVPGSYVVNTNEGVTVTKNATQAVEINNADTAVDSYALGATGPGQGYITYIVGNGRNPAHAAEPVTIYIARVVPPLYRGELKVVESSNPLSEMITFQHTSDLAGRSSDYEYDWRIMPPVDGQKPAGDRANWGPLAYGNDMTHYTLGGSGIQALSDNYVTMRYRCTNQLANPVLTNWSDWAEPILAQGWIKRVLQGVNPFNQRTKDLFDNPANTTASIISQAGTRWEGDIPLNQASLTNSGLIEIYETVLNRGKALSINSTPPINYGPANDALLLAAGYLNDLYMMLGSEAWANAANPTIGFGTADKTYGSIATALFCFQGQEPSLLEQNLALLRGRDDFLSPGVRLKPVYNRLFWNYTYGINAGEVIYALNYNINDQNNDGVVGAADAAMMYPQAHGDAYGHYLTALMNYYSLLMNPNFDWVPRSEAVTVLGATVAVDYQDERKFASAAAAVARAGWQVFDLTWRQNYQPGTSAGWSYFATNRVNPQRTYANVRSGTNNVTRYWGMDHWAARVGQGAYMNWIVGNAILPPVDTDSSHQGIQKVDRTTVPELQELPQTATALQNDMDNANAGFTPLGLSQNGVPFDINPIQVTGADPQTHFEQIYQRAVGALNNAVVAFNDAQNVTQLMRSEEDSLFNFSAGVTAQELAYNNQLIELYGTPYPNDIGPGQTYPQGYTGPDLIHYTYVETPDTSTYGVNLPDPTVSETNYLYIGQLPADWQNNMYQNFDFYTNSVSENYDQNTNYIPFVIGPNGFFNKPSTWTSQRVSPGSIQQSISTLVAAQNKLRLDTVTVALYDKSLLDRAFALFNAQAVINQVDLDTQNKILDLQQAVNNAQTGYNIADKWLTLLAQGLDDAVTLFTTTMPSTFIFGLASGGDAARTAQFPLVLSLDVAKLVLLTADAVGYTAAQSQMLTAQQAITDYSKLLSTDQNTLSLQNAVDSLGHLLATVQGDYIKLNQDLRALSDAQAAYDALVAKGGRIQKERQVYRQHAAALVQGYRTRDTAFRLFQNEKLERYKTLFDLAAKYAYMVANAYDYETGLLNTDKGRSFINRIVSSCALGVIVNGQPQYAGSSTGDPGLSSALAEMKADWDVLKGRLGFNNPDGYGTTVSLRTENYRIFSGADGDTHWKSVLHQGYVNNLLQDSDVKRHCMQIDDGSGQAVPGIVLTFSTVIADGQNLFGQALGPGDHNYSSSSFATKIFSVGVDFDGYIGMDNPSANSSSGGASPADPTLDPNALAATPYVYLIPCGTDAMRSPPLGDVSTIRTWNVDDLAVPLPYNISASDFSTTPFYTSANSLSEPLFTVRKHQAFRPVSTTSVFNTGIYGATGALQPSQYTNKRLIGRSVWNSQWKLVIPGKTLLADPKQGLSRFINSVKDVKLYFVTYSYSGN